MRLMLTTMRSAVAIACAVIAPAGYASALDAEWTRSLAESGAQVVRASFPEATRVVAEPVGSGRLHSPCGRHPASIESINLMSTQAARRMAASVRVRCGEMGREKTTTAWFNVQVHANVPVTTRALSAGEVLTPDAIRSTQLDVARLRGVAAALDNPERSIRLNVPLQQGEPVLQQQIEMMPDVIAGQPVRAIYRAGAVTVSFAGVALRDGSRGRLLKIRKPQTGETLSARVEGPGLVEFLP